jgi:hypothetical protein
MTIDGGVRATVPAGRPATARKDGRGARTDGRGVYPRPMPGEPRGRERGAQGPSAEGGAAPGAGVDPHAAGGRAPAGATERVGPLEVSRNVKADGRRLLLFRRVEDAHGEAPEPAEAVDACGEAPGPADAGGARGAGVHARREPP